MEALYIILVILAFCQQGKTKVTYVNNLALKKSS